MTARRSQDPRPVKVDFQTDEETSKQIWKLAKVWGLSRSHTVHNLVLGALQSALGQMKNEMRASEQGAQ